MPGLGEQPLAPFLDAVAEATPAPGGGTSAAVAAALGAALVEMAAGIASDSARASKAGSVRARLLALAEEELTSYEPVLQATRLPRDDPTRPVRIESALILASATPEAVARAAADVAELGVVVARSSSKEVRGDALAGVLLSEAAAAAAADLVEINLAGQPDARALEEARAARARAARAREEADATRGG